MNDPRDRQAKRQPDIKVVHVNCSTNKLQKYVMLCQHDYWFCGAAPLFSLLRTRTQVRAVLGALRARRPSAKSLVEHGCAATQRGLADLLR